MHPWWKMSSIELINPSITSLILLLRIFKFYSLSTFHFYNSVTNDSYYVGYVKFSGFIHLYHWKFTPFASLPVSQPLTASTQISLLKMAFFQFFQYKLLFCSLTWFSPIRVLKCTGRPRLRCSHGGSGGRYKRGWAEDNPGTERVISESASSRIPGDARLQRCRGSWLRSKCRCS